MFETTFNTTMNNPDNALDLEVQATQLTELYENGLTPILGQITAGIIILVVNWSLVPLPVLMAWFSVLIVSQAIRTAFSIKFRREIQAVTLKNIEFWNHVASFNASLSAFVWCIGAIVLWRDNAMAEQFIFCLVVILTNAAALTTLSSHRPSFSAYLLISCTPMALQFFSVGSFVHNIAGMCALLTMVFGLRIGNTTYQIRRKAVLLNAKYREQVTTLAKEKLQIEELNRQLAKQAEILQQGEARYYALSQATFEGIAMHQNGIIVDANESAPGLFGYTEEEFIGLPIWEVIAPESREMVGQYIGKGHESAYEVNGLRKDGSTFPLEVQAKNIVKGDNTIRVVAARDITFRKEAERNAISLTLEQQRIELLTKFVQNASHEFRTPLSVISTATYLISHMDRSEVRDAQVHKINAQVKRINTLVNDLLFLVQLDTEKEVACKPVHVNPLILSLTNSLYAEFSNKTQTLNLALSEHLPQIQADTDLLYRALHALLKNATRYTPENGEITIQTAIHDSHVAIRIKDTGIGIDEAYHHQIFERFYRVDEAHSTAGFGIGLPIAKRIVELHKGKISVNSQRHAGSTFEIHLPLVHSPMENAVAM